MNSLPCTKVPRTHPAPYCVCFAYPKSGARVLKGGSEEIYRVSMDSAVHHGMMLQYSPENPKTISRRKWVLLGKDATDYKLIRTSFSRMKKWAVTITKDDISTKHAVYVLLKTGDKGGWLFLGRWRRLPEKYLDSFEGEAILKKNW